MKTIHLKQIGIGDDVTFDCENSNGDFRELDMFIDNAISDDSKLLFDLTDVEHINSLMIGKLIKFSKVLKNKDIEMHVLASGPTHNILTNTGVSKIINLKEK